MKHINWSKEKNVKLSEERNISFEIVARYIEGKKILEIYQHSNTVKYPNQKIFAINIEGYVYLVPFIETDDEIFLKTIIPSRKATKYYLEERI